MSETETKEETKAAAAPETAKEEPPKENMMTKVRLQQCVNRQQQHNTARG